MHLFLLWFWRVLLALASVGLLSSSVYLVLALIGGIRFRHNTNTAGDYLPPISVLKPVHGAEVALEGNLRTLFQQDYPHFEIVFCARSLQDPAILCAQSLASQHPAVPVRYIASGEPVWANPKTFSMALLTEAAQFDTVLFSDSDVRVDHDYLRSIVQPLAAPDVGLVTSVFRGRALQGAWSSFTAFNQTVEFASGVLTANLLEDISFGLGPTLLTTKRHVERMGGFAAMKDLLADDFWLGNRIAALGCKVILSTCVVDHYVEYGTLHKSFQHQLGWTKNTRRTRPLGHLGTGLTFAVPFGILGLLAAAALGYAALGVTLFVASLVNRWLQAIFAAYSLRDRETLQRFWLNPASDLMGFAAWFCSYFGNTIDFRGEKYELLRDGSLVRHPVPAASTEQA